MTDAGDLHELYSFQARATASDGYGNTVSDWVEVFQTRGKRTFFRGIEKAQDASANASQKVVLTVYSFAGSRAVTTDYRVVDARSDELYNILAIEPSQDRQYIEFIVESGVADG